MLRAEDFILAAAQPPAQSTIQPPVVYVQSPRSSGRSLLLPFLLIVLTIMIVYGLYSGGIEVSREPDITASQPHITVVAVATQAPAWTLPTAAIVARVAAAQSAAPVQVIPQGQYHAPEPTVAPTAIIPTVAPEVQKVYASLLVPPTAIPLTACEAGSETYVTTPVKVLNVKGWPIGEVRGRSCISDEDAHNNATTLAQQVMDADKVKHPENWR